MSYRVKSKDGREDKYRVATLDFSGNFPDDRVLLASDVGGNAEKIAKIGENIIIRRFVRFEVGGSS